MINLGIFWCINAQVYGKVEQLPANTKPLVGKVDSSFEHWQLRKHITNYRIFL